MVVFVVKRYPVEAKNGGTQYVCQVGGLAAQGPSGLAASSAIFRYAAYVYPWCDLRNQGIIESRSRWPFKWYQLYYAHFKDENVNT